MTRRAVAAALALPRLLAVVSAQRNPKKGVSFAGSQSCATLQPHSDSSWWYTWSTHNGFDPSNEYAFCTDAAPASAARADGMDFVPNFWGGVPALADLDAETEANLEAATYVMTFNEPERADQANLSPASAAAQWSDLMEIATAYNLQVVAPCMTKDAFTWFNEWEAECTILYGAGGCHYDFTCIHIYQLPHPCDKTKNWECIGDETGYHAKNYLDQWYDNYGQKPIWITEYGCYPWTSTPGCTPQQHQDIMTQLTTIFESSEYDQIVHRYAWFTTYAFGGELGFAPGALNVANWEGLSNLNDDPTRCPNMEWISNVYGGNHCPNPPCNWGSKSIGECVTKADANALCHRPLVMTMDNDNCYCSKDACDAPVASYGGTKSWREVGPLSRTESSLTAMGQIYDSFGTTGPSPTPAPPTPAPPTPPSCTPYGSDPWSSGQGEIPCCPGLSSCLDDHYGTGQVHYRCYTCCSDPHDEPCPTPAPVDPPTPSPVDPPTPSPVEPPTPSPVEPPTPSPVSVCDCTAHSNKENCNTDATCCFWGNTECSETQGNPNSGTCCSLDGGSGGGGPQTSPTPAPAVQPTTTGGGGPDCTLSLGSGIACKDDCECQSSNCKGNGTCK